MYCPNLTHCYGCGKQLENGDQIIGYFEHYMHTACAPVFLLETKQTFTYRKGRWCDNCQTIQMFNLEENVYEHVATKKVLCL